MSDETMTEAAIITAIHLAVFAVLVLLQLFLSSRKNRFLGLIPIALVAGFDLYNVIRILTDSCILNPAATSVHIFASALPKLILLIVIHCLMRRKVNKNRRLDKMNKQDL